MVGRVKRSREGQRENKVGGEEEEVVVQLERAESRSCRVGECRGVVCREEELRGGEERKNEVFGSEIRNRGREEEKE